MLKKSILCGFTLVCVFAGVLGPFCGLLPSVGLVLKLPLLPLPISPDLLSPQQHLHSEHI